MFDAMLVAALKAVLVVPVAVGALAICFFGLRMRRLTAGAVGALLGAIGGSIVGATWLAAGMMPWAMVAGAVLVAGLYAGDERAHAALGGGLVGAVLAFLLGFDNLGVAIGIVACGVLAYGAPRVAIAVASALVGAVGAVLAVAWGAGLGISSALSFGAIAAAVALASAGAGYQYARTIARPVSVATVVPARSVVMTKPAMLEPQAA